MMPSEVASANCPQCGCSFTAAGYRAQMYCGKICQTRAANQRRGTTREGRKAPIGAAATANAPHPPLAPPLGLRPSEPPSLDLRPAEPPPLDLRPLARPVQVASHGWIPDFSLTREEYEEIDTLPARERHECIHELAHVLNESVGGSQAHFGACHASVRRALREARAAFGRRGLIDEAAMATITAMRSGVAYAEIEERVNALRLEEQA